MIDLYVFREWHLTLFTPNLCTIPPLVFPLGVTTVVRTEGLLSPEIRLWTSYTSSIGPLTRYLNFLWRTVSPFRTRFQDSTLSRTGESLHFLQVRPLSQFRLSFWSILLRASRGLKVGDLKYVNIKIPVNTVISHKGSDLTLEYSRHQHRQNQFRLRGPGSYHESSIFITTYLLAHSNLSVRTRSRT